MQIKHAIGVIGTGYVGLVTAACFAHLGVHVHGVDTDVDKIAGLNNHIMPIYEQDLAPLVAEGKASGKLVFSSDLARMLQEVDTVFIAVGTPTQAKTGGADLSYLQAVAKALGPLLQAHRYLVIKSTVPVGTSVQFTQWLKEANPSARFTMVSNPEFLREGLAVSDFLNPDRILIGVETEAGLSHMQDLYKPLSEKGIPVLCTNIVSAELIKYAANGFLATKIAFINEMASLCDKVGANIEHVVAGIGSDKRIGPGYLQPGPGFGGSCFPKDTLALQSMGQAAGMPLSVIEGVVASNIRHKQRMVENIVKVLGPNLAHKRLSIWGLAFKAGTDDIRESASIDIIKALLTAGAVLRVFDPVVTKGKFDLSVLDDARDNAHRLMHASSCEESMEDTEAVIIVTEWPCFKFVDWNLFKRTHDRVVRVIDFRNLYDPIKMAQSGIAYVSLGRPAVHPATVYGYEYA
ncbi:MAG: hypothetical protein RLZ35_1268 [Pseudomonadota bacterium]|jgi:UDPglucose 6-dehydrogenase